MTNQGEEPEWKKVLEHLKQQAQLSELKKRARSEAAEDKPSAKPGPAFPQERSRWKEAAAYLRAAGSQASPDLKPFLGVCGAATALALAIFYARTSTRGRATTRILPTRAT